MAREKRFVRTYINGTFDGFEIWVDRATGVNYLARCVDNGGGLTPLLNADGSPVVTPLGPEE